EEDAVRAALRTELGGKAPEPLEAARCGGSNEKHSAFIKDPAPGRTRQRPFIGDILDTPCRPHLRRLLLSEQHPRSGREAEAEGDPLRRCEGRARYGDVPPARAPLGGGLSLLLRERDVRPPERPEDRAQEGDALREGLDESDREVRPHQR